MVFSIYSNAASWRIEMARRAYVLAQLNAASDGDQAAPDNLDGCAGKPRLHDRAFENGSRAGSRTLGNSIRWEWAEPNALLTTTGGGSSCNSLRIAASSPAVPRCCRFTYLLLLALLHFIVVVKKRLRHTDRITVVTVVRQSVRDNRCADVRAPPRRQVARTWLIGC